MRPAQKEVQAWNGEGLPPVGAVCENHVGDGIWKKSRIVAHDLVSGEQRVIFRFCAGDQVSYFGKPAECFRPLRTPEQIAAEERQTAIEEMVKLNVEIVLECSDRGESVATRTLMEAMYDAGYRKQVAP